jgi:predicted esterase
MGGDPGRVVLAGWSLGANAAAWVALHPGAFDGWAPVALVGLAGSYDESPFGGDVIAEAGHDGAGRRAVLVHGTRDTVVPPVRSVTTADHLAGLGWMAGLRMLETDHAGIVGTEYDPWRRRCVPTADTARIATRAAVASLVAEAAFGTSE